MPRPIRILFIVHGVINAAAGVVLLVAPALIPSTVNVTLTVGGELVPWLLGAVELGIAVISVGAAFLRDGAAVRLIAVAFGFMHLVTAIVEGMVLALFPGVSPLLWGNIAVRVIAVVLFAVAAARTRSPR